MKVFTKTGGSPDLVCQTLLSTKHLFFFSLGLLLQVKELNSNRIKQITTTKSEVMGFIG